ncbi:MAG: hypothetical protein CVT77_18760 [Alphaproteobacteria bacterium HGW-Alphaproteobacteria-16]|nr:MAG: hypothetical protein CVT77_18760 [Alphaproteobacteria bacterium HGW-Alphaproteobacteria-16]
MAAKNQVIGKARVRIDGVLLDTAGDTSLEPGGVMREPVEGDFDPSAFREGAPKPAKLDLNILTKGSFSATAFGAIVGATISVEFDNGTSWVIRDAYAEAAPTITTSDGKAKGVLYGKPAEPVR